MGKPRRTLTRQLSGGSTGKALRSRLVDCNTDMAGSPVGKGAIKRDLHMGARRGSKKAKIELETIGEMRRDSGAGDKLAAHWPQDTSSPLPKGDPKGDAKKRKASASGSKEEGSWKDLLGQIVDIPAPVFNVDIPDMYYRGVVKKKDTAHKDALVIRFVEDGSTYWLPIAEVRHWLKEMQLHGRTFASRTIGAGSDNFAARVLTDLRTSSLQNSGTSAQPDSINSAQKDGPETAEITSVPRRRRTAK